MMKKVLLATFVALAAANVSAQMAAEAPAAAKPAVAPGSTVPALFHKPVFFRGVVGDILEQDRGRVMDGLWQCGETIRSAIVIVDQCRL